MRSAESEEIIICSSMCVLISFILNWTEKDKRLHGFVCPFPWSPVLILFFLDEDDNLFAHMRIRCIYRDGEGG